MKRIICNTRCKHGLKARDSFIAWRKREISTVQFKQDAQDIACFCFPCVHNEIRGVKGKILKTAFPNSFQCVDMSEVEND